jgi:hypothetical protein
LIKILKTEPQSKKINNQKMPTTSKRVGFYCWAGPGTIRMINLKYFNPPINSKSLMQSYDSEYLTKAQRLFGLTDAWVTYSWGFAEETEKEDRGFILSRLENFKKLGIKTHAYIQGPNLVYKDYENSSWFCIDEYGDLIPYARGRKIVCINNPKFKKYLKDKITEACNYDFDGIFIDNIQMGKLGLPGGENYSTSFVGCYCNFCKEKFKSLYNLEIPKVLKKHSLIRKLYLEFRTICTTKFLQEMAEVVHSKNKLFGTNSYDPKFNSSYCYGTNLAEVAKIQDYLLFENHSLPALKSKRNNSYINEIAKKVGTEKPIFIVSYKKGIGFDCEFTQSDVDRIFSETVNSQFSPCLKASEFVTKKVWHNLNLENYRKPRLVNLENSNIRYKSRRSLLSYPLVDLVIRKYGLRAMVLYFENKFARKVLSSFYKNIIK